MQNSLFNKIDTSSLVISKLEIGEKVKSFDCGDEDLNDFIVNDSNAYREALLAITYVIEEQTDTQHSQIKAFFSLANDRISLTDFESKTTFNRFRSKRFVNKKRIRSYPAVKICRLGISQTMQGMKLGSFILDFIKTYFIVNNKTGCRFITVDAYQSAVDFYKRNGFIPLNEEDKDEPTRLLYFDLKDII